MHAGTPPASLAFLSTLAPLPLLLALAWPGQAAAFERTRDPFTGVCLWSEAREIDFWLDEGCEVEGSREACREAVAAALSKWNQSGCSDVHLRLAGTLRDARVESDVDHPEANVWLIRLEAPPGAAHRLSAEELEAGHSIVTYDRATGRIVDADVQIELAGLSADTLHNLVLHEAGHALGLAHARSPRAVMFASSPAAPRREALGADDLAALCSLYPAGQPTPTCGGGGSRFAQRRFAATLDGGEGCASAGGPAGLVLLAAFALAGWRSASRGRGQRVGS